MKVEHLTEAYELRTHLLRRTDEMEQIDALIGAIGTVTLVVLSDNTSVTIDLTTDIADSEAFRCDIIASLRQLLENSIEATRDHLTELGVEL